MKNNHILNTISLSLAQDDDCEKLLKIAHALSSAERLNILNCLRHKNLTLTEIAKLTSIPFSSLLRHIDVLSQANIIRTEYKPGLKGHAKHCSLKFSQLQLTIEPSSECNSNDQETFIEMPIGMFTDCDFTAPCGMLSTDGPIGEMDDPGILFLPERKDAECIWFTSGYITYHFPSSFFLKQNCQEISFSFEVCSETAYYNNSWPSDITVSVNKVEVLTFTSPGDFGGRRGNFTPKFWPTTSTQYGLLKKVTINNKGVYLDNTFLHNQINLDNLQLTSKNMIEFKLEVKKDAVHCGGMNLFGAKFGNYPQAIIMSVR